MAPGRGSSGGREEEQARCADGWARLCLKGQFRSSGRMTYLLHNPVWVVVLERIQKLPVHSAQQSPPEIPNKGTQDPDERGRFSPYTKERSGLEF
jgi:hypothetical protein